MLPIAEFPAVQVGAQFAFPSLKAHFASPLYLYDSCMMMDMFSFLIPINTDGRESLFTSM